MDNISVDQSFKTENNNAPLDLTLLKENPQIQQLLLLALSKTNQENQHSEPSMDNDKRKFDQFSTQSVSSTIGSTSDHSSPGSDSGSDKILGRPGRKPLTEEEIKQSDLDPKSKRKAQNRVAQRAFRERRVNYVKELEERIKTLEETQQQPHPVDEKLVEENRELKRIIQQLQTENAILGGTASSFDVPLSKLTNMTNTNSSSTTTATNDDDDDRRPQKLLRSLGDDSTATLFSAITTAASQQQPYHDHHDPLSSSPDATAVSFALHHHYHHSMADHGSSSSVSSTKSRSLTPPDTTFADDAILFSSATPTDILNSFDPSQLMNPFTLDQDLFNTLNTTTSVTTTDPLTKLSQHPSSSSPPTTTTRITTDGSPSNDLIESLLVIDDDDVTDSSSSSTDNNNNNNTIHPTSTVIGDNGVNDTHCYNMDSTTLTQTWDKLMEHPRFDEFDIDLLCDEMKRKALCTNKPHEEQMKDTINKYYPHGSSTDEK